MWLDKIEIQMTDGHTNVANITDKIKVVMKYPRLVDMRGVEDMGNDSLSQAFTILKHCVWEVNDGEKVYRAGLPAPLTAPTLTLVSTTGTVGLDTNSLSTQYYFYKYTYEYEDALGRRVPIRGDISKITKVIGLKNTEEVFFLI